MNFFVVASDTGSELVSLERRIELVGTLGAWVDANADERSDIAGVVWDDEGTRLGIRLRAHCKEIVMLWVAVGERTTFFESYLMPYPELNETLVLQYLLRRNHQMMYFHSAQHSDHAIYLVGRTATARVGCALLDEYLGSVLLRTEEIFPTAMALGFGSTYRYRPIPSELSSKLTM